jgi:putative endonuclease
VPWVYILRCGDGSLYVGLTSDLDARERTHNEGRGGAYTALRRPVKVVYSEEFMTLNDARQRERQLKRWSGMKKVALIEANTPELQRLSRCRQRTKS